MKLKGFPVSLLSHMRCNKDAGILIVDEKTSGAAKFIVNGADHCLTCGTRYPIQEGILDLLGIATLQNEGSSACPGPIIIKTEFFIRISPQPP